MKGLWKSFGGERSWPGFMMCLKNLFFSVVSTLLHVDPRKVVFVVSVEASPLPRECMHGFWVQTGSYHVNAHSAGGGGGGIGGLPAVPDREGSRPEVGVLWEQGTGWSFLHQKRLV